MVQTKGIVPRVHFVSSFSISLLWSNASPVPVFACERRVSETMIVLVCLGADYIPNTVVTWTLQLFRLFSIAVVPTQKCFTFIYS